MAGFASRPGDMIHMIKEPEAAAMACLHLTKRENKDLIKVRCSKPLFRQCHD